MNIKFFFGIALFLFFTYTSGAQQVEPDTDTVSVVKKHSPKKAALMSAVLPGLGQAYNRKYWKIPIIYAGAGALGYAFHFNRQEFKYYNNAYVAAADDDPNTNYNGPYSPAQLKSIRDFYRRNLDLTVIGMSLLYALNIIDAVVDAHLYDFDVSDDLSLKFEPQWQVNSFLAQSNFFELKVKLSFNANTEKIFRR